MAENSKTVIEQPQDEVVKQTPPLAEIEAAASPTTPKVVSMTSGGENILSIIPQPQVVTLAPPQTQAQSFVITPAATSTPTSTSSVAHGHIRIPTVPIRASPSSTKPATIALARPATMSGSTFLSSGHHKLPMTPIMTTSNTMVKGGGAKTSPISLAVLQQSEVVKPAGTLEISSKSGISQGANIRPISTSLTLAATGFPVTIRSQSPGSKPTVVTNSPIQLVPLSSSNQIRASGQTTIRQVTPIKATAVRSPLEQTSAVKVTVVQSPAPLAKLTPGQTSFYKPVTMSSQATRQIRPQTQLGATTGQPLRITGPNTSRMTVVSGQPQHSINVALSPSSHISIPAQQNQQPMARILTGGTATRLISMPTSQNSSGGVTIQKAIGTTALPISKALAGGISQSPKAIGTSGIPVARIIPQATSSESANLYITSSSKPLLQPYVGEDGRSQLIVTTLPSATTLDLTQGGLRTPQKNQNEYGAANLTVPASPRPGILRRRPEGVERGDVIEVPSICHPSNRPESQDDGGSSSGSTTLSATSSPCDAGNLSGEEMQTSAVVPSPRKKPRKQQYSNVREHSWSEPTTHQQEPTETPKRKYLGVKQDEAANKSAKNSGFPDSTGSYVKNKPQMSLLSSYRHTWKSRHNHFLRYSDIKPREERRPTVNEIASQTNVMQKLNGWKIYHMSAQIEDITDIEIEFTKKLAQLQKKLDKFGHKDLGKDITANQEIIKANLQRSRLIQDQISDAKRNCIQVFEHKTKVSEIMGRYSTRSGRHVKKRDSAYKY